MSTIVLCCSSNFLQPTVTQKNKYIRSGLFHNKYITLFSAYYRQRRKHAYELRRWQAGKFSEITEIGNP